MINSDLIIGFVVGNVYGYFFRTIFQFFFRNSVLIFKRSLLPSFVVLVFVGIIPSIGVGGFILTILFLKPYIMVWKVFISIFMICFFVGMSAYAVLHRKQVNKWD
jgi:hypothetical protein